MNEKINELYFNPKFPASLSSLQKFYREAKKVIKDLTYRDIVAWSKQSETYTMHKSARKNFRRERIYTNSIDYLWEIDLVDVSRLKEYNDGYTFLLICIDTFSKYVWIRPLKKKTGKAFNLVLVLKSTFLREANREYSISGREIYFGKHSLIL